MQVTLAGGVLPFLFCFLKTNGSVRFYKMDLCVSSTMFMCSQPGSDSGTTAVVALIRGKQLIVANAGDSRCVVSERGMSNPFDLHLPQ